jgi:malate dehydrogenase
LFGVTTLDVVRTSTFVSELHSDLGLAPKVVVPVIGGHSGVTIIPLLSQSSHPLPNATEEDIKKLTNRIQFGGDEVVKAKDGAGSATLSMAYAGAEFAEKVIRAFKGEKGIVAPSYVNLAADKEAAKTIGQEIGKDLDYFSANVELGVRIFSPTNMDQLKLASFRSRTVWRRFTLLESCLLMSRSLSRPPSPSSKGTSRR